MSSASGPGPDKFFKGVLIPVQDFPDQARVVQFGPRLWPTAAYGLSLKHVSLIGLDPTMPRFIPWTLGNVPQFLSWLSSRD